jgi:putative PIN family toxin of toxin-antitoxin system
MKLVLDTNVVLDWLRFRVPALAPLSPAIRTGQVSIHTHALALEELRRVLDFPQLEVSEADRTGILEAYRTQSVPFPLEDRLLLEREGLPERFPRCRDPDDDRFLALAWHSQADALVSKDKALLKLQRRSRAFGFSILNLSQLLALLESS